MAVTDLPQIKSWSLLTKTVVLTAHLCDVRLSVYHGPGTIRERKSC